MAKGKKSVTKKSSKSSKKVARRAAGAKMDFASGRLRHGVPREALMVSVEETKMRKLRVAAKEAELTVTAYVRGAIDAALEGKTLNAKKLKESFVVQVAA